MIKKYWVLFIIIITSCSSSNVIKFLNTELDYSKYLTYRLIYYKSDDKSFSTEGQSLYTEIEKAIDQNMKDKKYVFAEKPDLIARYEIISTTATESNSSYYDPYGYNSYYTPRSTRKYTEGIVLIELRDRKQKKLVWQGSLDLNSSRRRDVETSIFDSINEIFESYPYEAGSNEPVISPQ